MLVQFSLYVFKFTNMDDITEVVVVEEYDLEEGEITDDSVVELDIVSAQPKKKKLPKRYCLNEKKVSNEKHKKDYKHSPYSNQNVKNKSKSSLISNSVHKKHKSSCPLQHQISDKRNLANYLPPLINHTNPVNHQISNMKSAFKNFSSPPRPVQKLQKPSLSDHQDDSYRELLSSYKKYRGYTDNKSLENDIKRSSPKTSQTVRKSLKNHDKSQLSKDSPSPKTENKRMLHKTAPKCENEQSLNKASLTKSENGQHIGRTSPAKDDRKHLNKTSPTKDEGWQHLNKTSPMQVDSKSPINKKASMPKSSLARNPQETCLSIVEKAKREDSEDEDELRKIALATVLQKSLAEQEALESGNNENSPPLSNHLSGTRMVNSDNCSSDNYEVVDMELDDENFSENVDEKLFVIDNKPAMTSDFKQDILYDQSLHPKPSPGNVLPSENQVYPSADLANSNEDFEEALLRAELIASINKKSIAQDIAKPNHTTNILSAAIPPDFIDKVVNVSSEDNIPKPNAACFKEQNDSFALNAKRKQVKPTNFKLTSKKVVPQPRNINVTQERLIITLNNDSSSDDDSDENESSNKNVPESTVTSIDDLISKARYKSDIKNNGYSLNHVSVLSKAQQEEYQKLKNLLAEKEPMTIIPQAVKEKSNVEHQNLNYLTNKISLAREKLDKDKETLLSAEKEVLSKKKMYLSSKLKFQHLQEQLHAAKLDKATNLKSWKVHEAKLGNARSVVAKQKALISLLEAELNNRSLQLEQNSSSPLI